MTDFKDGNGNPISAEAFENEPSRGPGEQVFPKNYIENLAAKCAGQKKSEA